MTYRAYLRWPKQRVSDKTVTQDPEIADAAFRKLVRDFRGKPAAAVLSQSGKQREYIKLDGDPMYCRQCRFLGPLVRNNTTCAECLTVQ